jgi:hypothetical protein
MQTKTNVFKSESNLLHQREELQVTSWDSICQISLSIVGNKSTILSLSFIRNFTSFESALQCLVYLFKNTHVIEI